MAKLAIVEIAVAESAFIVVAGHAFHRAVRRKMLSRRGRADLSALRRARYH